MIIVVDGYNVLKGAIHAGNVSQKERNHFVAQLGKYADAKDHKVITVFDGGASTWPEKQRMNGVTVIYSGYNQTADDYIKKYLEENKLRDILLVSTDRELCSFAMQRDIVTIDSQDFYDLLCNALAHGKSVADELPIVQIADDIEDIDALMQAASEHVPIKAVDMQSKIKTRIASSKTPSKRDRKLNQILKKL